MGSLWFLQPKLERRSLFIPFSAMCWLPLSVYVARLIALFYHFCFSLRGNIEDALAKVQVTWESLDIILFFIIEIVQKMFWQSIRCYCQSVFFTIIPFCSSLSLIGFFPFIVEFVDFHFHILELLFQLVTCLWPKIPIVANSLSVLRPCGT